jgi:hypothetical protein
VANWPGYMREYEESVRTFNPDDFGLVPLPTWPASEAIYS